MGVRVGFVQTRPHFGEKEINFKEVSALTRGIQADLLVLPELFATGYAFVSSEEAAAAAETMQGVTAEYLRELSARTGAVIVAGFVERDGDSIYNAALIVTPSGFMDTYRKIHLFNKETLWFSPGNKPLPVYTESGFRFGVMICFDWYFPESMRVLAVRGAEIVAHPSNLVLPYCQNAMKTRCLENRVFAVTANRTGRERRLTEDFHFTGASQITGLDGGVLGHASVHETCVHVIEVRPESARDKHINPYNDLFRDRKVANYEPILEKEAEPHG